MSDLGRSRRGEDDEQKLCKKSSRNVLNGDMNESINQDDSQRSSRSRHYERKRRRQDATESRDSDLLERRKERKSSSSHYHRDRRRKDDVPAPDESESESSEGSRRKRRNKERRQRRRRRQDDSESDSTDSDRHKRSKKKKSKHKKKQHRRRRDDSSSSASEDARNASSRQNRRRPKTRKQKMDSKSCRDGTLDNNPDHAKQEKSSQVECCIAETTTLPVAAKPLAAETPQEETGTNPAIRRARMVPMSREQYEAEQSIIREVYDEESGRYRLVRGSGEIIERIVSRSAHQQINQTATRGDGSSFSRSVYQALNYRK